MIKIPCSSSGAARGGATRVMAIAWAVFSAVGCSGSIDGAGAGDEPGDPSDPGSTGSGARPTPAGPGSGGAGGVPGPAVVMPPPDGAKVGPAGLRRLSRRELDNTLRDLIGDDTHVARQFVADPSSVANGYAAFAPLGSAELQQYRDAAEALAGAALKRSPALAACASPGDELACARGFVTDFGKRAFRRPLEASEAQALVDLYSDVRAKTKAPHDGGVRVVLTAMLQDPRFLYQRQLGAGAPTAGLVALDGYDMASRLSYALWRTMPDAKLFQAAEAGHLATETGVRAEATRLLADARGREATTTWAASLLGLDRLPSLARPADKYPEWSAALAASMYAETEAFVAAVVLDGDARVETLLTTPVAFVDAALAKVYGAPAPAGSSMTRVELDPKRRAGLLTQASFLTTRPSPVLRGQFIREQLFCQHVPPPPPDAQGRGQLAPAGSTERQRVNAHATDPGCAACHRLMDPVGFPFLSFDAIGRHQTTDQGKPIDASGELVGTDVDGPLVGPIEMSSRLAKSASVKTCVTTRWFRALLDRGDTADDATSMAAATGALATGTKPLRELILALVTSPSFRFRTPLAGEKTP